MEETRMPIPGGLPAVIVICRAEPSLFATIARFRFRMFEDIEPGVDHAAEEASYIADVEAYFLRHASDPGQVILVACDPAAGDRVIGCAAMIVSERPPRFERRPQAYAYLHNVYVLPEYRGRGIARILVLRLQEEAATMKARRIGLHASTLGAPVYEALGYARSKKYLELELPD